MRRYHREVRRGGHREAGRPGVRDDLPPVLASELDDATGRREATDSADVGLRDLHAAVPDQHLEVMPGRKPLSSGDADRRARRELGVSGDIIAPERRLEEIDVEACGCAKSVMRRGGTRG